MSCVVVCILLGVVRCFGGVPARPYIIWGDGVTWKVLAEYQQNSTPSRSGSFLILQLVLLLYEYLLKMRMGRVDPLDRWPDPQ